jgi:hypothetical protein
LTVFNDWQKPRTKEIFVSSVFRPKEGNHTFLEDYRKAEEIGKSNQVKKIEID